MRGLKFALAAMGALLCSAAAQAQVVISQVYGGGGNANAIYGNDFIEIYNRGASGQSLSGWSVQYASATGTTWSVTALPAVTLAPGQYLLIQEAAGSTRTSALAQGLALPTPDATGTIAMAAADFKVALVNVTTALTGATPTGAQIMDLVGCGTTTTWNEPGAVFSSANNAPAGSNTLAVFRNDCGNSDTNNNAQNFGVGIPSPRNTATAPNLGMNGTGMASPYLLKAGQSTRLSVSPRLCGAAPFPSGATSVLVNAAAVGLGTVALLDDGTGGDDVANDGIYCLTVTIPGGTAVGSYALPVTFTDGTNLGGAYIGLFVTAVAAPANDNAATAQAITGPYLTPVDTTSAYTGATVEYNPFSALLTAPTSGMGDRRGVWYTVTGSGNTLTASLCPGVALDSVLIVMCGNPDGLTVVANGDDAGPGCTGSAASASWCSLAGQTYYVWVAPFATGASTSAFTLRISDNGTACSGATVCTSCTLTKPSGASAEVESPFGPAINDGCDTTPNRFTDIVASPTILPIYGTLRAYADARDTDWYRFQASATDTLGVTVTANHNVQVSLRQLGAGGICTGATTLVTSASSARCATLSLTQALTAGTWYAVRIIHTPTPTFTGGTDVGGTSCIYTGTIQLGVPTPPTCSTSVLPTTVLNDGSGNITITTVVTPGTNPPSVTHTATANLTSIGGGAAVAMTEGPANTFTLAYTVPNGTTTGAKTITTNVTETSPNARTTSCNTTLTVNPAPPACPPGTNPRTFTNIDHAAAIGSANNSTISAATLNWTSADVVDKIHISGRLTEINTATFASEARFLVTFSDATTITLQPFTSSGYTGFVDVADYIFDLSPDRVASTIVSIEAFESFDDGTDLLVDSRWSSLCFTYDASILPTNPGGTPSATPTNNCGTNSMALSVVVAPGLNPPSTNHTVTVDLTNIGGPNNASFVEGPANTFTYSQLISNSITPGVKTLAYTIQEVAPSPLTRSATGNISATVNGCPPANDECSGALPVLAGTTAFNNAFATTGVPDVAPTCQASFSHTLWYTYTPICSGVVTISTCAQTTLDSILTAYADCTAAAAGTELACSDDACSLQSTITVTGTQGVPFIFRLASFSTATGSGTFTITEAVTPPAITVNPLPAIKVCDGGAINLSVTATGTSLSYQWRLGGVAIGGATASSYSVPAATLSDAGNYDVVVSNSCGSVLSTLAVVEVNINTAVTQHPGNVKVCTGSDFTVTVVAVGKNLTYQWRKNGVAIGGATASSYGVIGATAADSADYDCVVSGDCGNATSNIAVVEINPTTDVITDPSSGNACEGQPFGFTVVAVGKNLTYQWRKNGVDIGGATTAAYNIAAVAAGDAASYDCVVSGDCGNDTSAAATLTVDTAPVINTQPNPVSVCVGQAINLSVGASGSPAPTYQWRKNGVAIGGETAASLSIAVSAVTDSGSYDCVVTNTCGSVTTTAVAVAVSAGPTITAQPSNTVVAEGFAASFTVGATGTGTLSYQWRKDTANLVDGGNIAGANTATLYVYSTVLADEGTYDCIVTDDCGSTTSSGALLDVNGCLADVDDGNGTGIPDGGVGIEDLLYYLALYDAGNLGADVDDGFSTGIRDNGVGIEDLLYYLYHYDIGC